MSSSGGSQEDNTMENCPEHNIRDETAAAPKEEATYLHEGPPGATQRTGRSAASSPQAEGQEPEITAGLYALPIAARCDPIHESRSSDAEPGVRRKISATVVGVALGSPRSD